MLHEIKEIFVVAFDIKNLNEKAPIISQQLQIMEKVNDIDIESNEKLIQWTSRRLEEKVIEKISTKIKNSDNLFVKSYK